MSLYWDTYDNISFPLAYPSEGHYDNTYKNLTYNDFTYTIEKANVTYMFFIYC